MKILLVTLMALAVQVIAGPLAATVLNRNADGDLELIPDTLGPQAISTPARTHKNMAASNVERKDDHLGPMPNAIGILANVAPLQVTRASREKILRTVIGNQKQYVGQYNKNKYPRNIADLIAEAIRNRCDDTKPIGTWCDRTPNPVNGVQYSATKNHGELSNNAWFDVAVAAEMIPSRPGLLKALIDYISTVYELMTNDDKNCFVKRFTIWALLFPQKIDIRFCNVASWVAVYVEVPDQQGFNFAYFNVTVQFNSKSKDGHFDCFAVMAAIDDYSKKSFGGFEKAFDTKGFGSDVQCPDKAVT